MSLRCRMFTPAMLILMVGMLGACRCQTNERPLVSQIRIEPAQPNYTIVVGEQASLMVSASGSSLRFQWKAERGRLSSSTSSATLYTAPDEPGLDTVSVKVTGNCGVTEQSITIRIIPRSTSTPTSTFTPTPTPPTPTPTFTPTPSPSPGFTPTPSPSPTPTPVVVTLRTWSGMYVTATDITSTWKLKAQDTPVGVQQKFTLLCLANGKAAFQVSNTFVTALNDEAGRDWEMRAGMTARQEWEEFTLVNPDTREQLPCRQVVEQLGQNPVRLAIQTFHQKDGKNRFVTAMGEDRDWVIRAETTELKQWEVFTAAIAPAPCATCTGCLTGRGYGCSANMPAGAVPYCAETFSLASPVTATQIRIEMTKRALANYGYSLYEVQAYGPADAQTNLLAPYLFSLKVDPATLAAGQVSAPLREQFRDPAPVLGPQAQIKAGPVGGQWIITDTDRIYVIRSEKQELNVYGGMQVRASSIEGDGYIAPYAIDGIDNNKASRWSSAHCCVSKNCPADEKGNPVCDNPAGRDPQWLEITLPKPAQISRIVLKWEDAYAVEYCVIVVGMSD